jgi:hypothetical protein
MAASLLIEEESGTYTGRIRHRHNGYYAGDFSQTPPSGSELRLPSAEGRHVFRAASPDQPAGTVHISASLASR